MAFVSVLQILKVNEERTGVKDGRPWALQDAECIGLGADGAPEWVGVLRLPKDLRGKVTPGTFSAAFTLRPNMSTKVIEAQLTGLTPLPPAARPPAVQRPAAAA